MKSCWAFLCYWKLCLLGHTYTNISMLQSHVRAKLSNVRATGPDRKGGVQRVISDPLGVHMCSMCHTKEADVLWVSAQHSLMESCGVETHPLSTQGTHPPPACHYRFTLLAALKRDGTGWCTSREFVSSPIHDPQIQDSVRTYTIVIYFSSNNTVL